MVLKRYTSKKDLAWYLEELTWWIFIKTNTGHLSFAFAQSNAQVKNVLSEQKTGTKVADELSKDELRGGKETYSSSKKIIHCLIQPFNKILQNTVNDRLSHNPQ